MQWHKGLVNWSICSGGNCEVIFLLTQDRMMHSGHLSVYTENSLKIVNERFKQKIVHGQTRFIYTRRDNIRNSCCTNRLNNVTGAYYGKLSISLC